MPAFEPPQMTYMKDKAWRHTAKPGFRNSKILWDDYWVRFNTMAVPILDEDAFFADAMAAAKYAENRGHLEELLAEKHEERRQDLEKVVRDIALSSICLQQQYPSMHARDAALKIGQTGSLDSFIQFVCGVVFGWKDSEKGEPMARVGSADDAGVFDNEANVRGNSDTQGDTQEDALDDGGDSWQYENTFPPELCSSPGWDEQVDDVWNCTSRRVTECHNIEETPLEHRVPSSSTDAYPEVSQIREGEENEKERRNVERPYELPSTSSESPANHGSSSQPRCPSPRPTDDTSTNTASPPPSTASQLVTSPHPSQALSHYTTRSSSELSGAQAKDKSCSSTKLSTPTGPGLSEEPAGDTQRGGLAAGTGSTRKRSFFHEGYEEDVDEGHKRRRRRISA